jgi:hypothetical protein
MARRHLVTIRRHCFLGVSCGESFHPSSQRCYPSVLFSLEPEVNAGERERERERERLKEGGREGEMKGERLKETAVKLSQRCQALLAFS